MSDFKLCPWSDYTRLKMKAFPNSKEMGQKRSENNWTLPEVDIRSQDISSMDLSEYDMKDVTFDDKTKWPAEDSKCPQKYDRLQKIIESGKNPGLGIRALHKKGIDGEGLSMAIIDQPLSDHIEYRDNLVHYEEVGNPYRQTPKKGSMHGSAVASLAVGKNCGIAPKAKLYYFAAENTQVNEETKETSLTALYCAKALERIMQINEVLPKTQRIQVVSMSWGGQSDEKVLYAGAWLKALENAKKNGLFVLTCASSKEYNLNFSGMGRKILGNPDSILSYTEKSWGQPASETVKKRLLVPMENRTTAAPNGDEDYVHYCHGGLSWATPWLAGVFLLARQVSPKISPKHFWEVALKTGVVYEHLNGTIIQPEQLIDTLQKEQNILMIQKMKGKQNAK